MMLHGISPMSFNKWLSTLSPKALVPRPPIHHSDSMTLLHGPDHATMSHPRCDPSWIPLVPENLYSPTVQAALPIAAEPSPPPPNRTPQYRLRAIAVPAAVALVETICGQRSLQQLDHYVDHDVKALIARLRSRYRGSPLRLRSLRVQANGPRHIEVSLHLSHAEHSRAAAVQLSYCNGQWVTTAFVIALGHHTVQA